MPFLFPNGTLPSKLQKKLESQIPPEKLNLVSGFTLDKTGWGFAEKRSQTPLESPQMT